MHVNPQYGEFFFRVKYILDIFRYTTFLMKTLSERIAKANTLLAPYAVPHGGGLGRESSEAEDSTRFPFQRDRDRIIHTQAFRRLKHKTQVFVSGHGDHYRTRITHTLEVAQISRDIARTLGLNEDLAECIALAHDLGHTPFGHAGEDAMNTCMQTFGKLFEHNEQSLRIATLLEERSSRYPGLNLSREILEGLMKHRTPHDSPSPTKLERSPSLEAELVNLADEIAYTAHDTDDALRAKLCTEKDVALTSLGKAAYERSRENGTELRGAIVGLLVEDLYRQTESNLKFAKIATLHNVYATKDQIVAFSESLHEQLSELRQFLWNRLYQSPSVLRQANRGRRILRSLFTHYLRHPNAKIKLLMKKTGSELEDAVKDYIAGMTDTFATEQAAQCG